MASEPQSQRLFGHPAGLYTLFFAEMWERFSYYGMRALLVFYMLKGFLAYGDERAYATYGAYTALVYMTPFFGGMLADKLLGARRAVVFGGLLMAAGHLLMTVENSTAFFLALALLITGNGFFKPNISTMVGELYGENSPKRDGGFTIFYMGVNLGAAMSPLLCGYIGETYGWHYGFGLATIGMLTGLAVFAMPGGAARALILGAALLAAVTLFTLHPNNPFLIAINVFVGVALLAAAGVAWVSVSRGGLPAEVGQPPRSDQSAAPRFGLFPKTLAVYLGALLCVPVLALMVSGFSPLTKDHKTLVLVPTEFVERFTKSDSSWMQAIGKVVAPVSKAHPSGYLLVLAGLVAAGYLGFKVVRLERIARQRMYVVLVLTFASMLFWAFFEQAGSSVNNFTDRNVRRVFHAATARVITAADVGTSVRLQPTQDQLGFRNDGQMFTLNQLDALRKEHGEDREFEIDWRVSEDNVGMRVARRSEEVPASVLQAVNAVYILVLGLAFTALWSLLGTRGFEPSTPFKFALGLLQLGLGFVAFWYGAVSADERGMVSMSWLLLGYLLHTTGELCISPVGLSMVTKLSPRDLVSTVMGTWFLATAFSQFLAAMIAQFTRVETAEGAEGVVPPPLETVAIYGDVFGRIAIAAVISAAIFFALTPLLKTWMHEGVAAEADGA
jgi:proton-dependent oligopeptide transporter, POT family